ncbi:MAG TPA: DUF5130 family protein [Mycobacteriales bacterium]|nr:DUF5130 family protein [Mycobacteriales bacterium]
MAGKALTARQVRRVEQAVDRAERMCGLQFAVFVGGVEDDPGAYAEQLMADLGLSARPAVLVLVAPPQRRFEIRTAPHAQERLSDAACRMAAVSMTASFAVGDIVGGVCEGLRLLAQHAGPGEPERGEDELPDVLLGTQVAPPAAVAPAG